ncbi:MAG: DoxX family protein [Bauldia sp.]|nr:DoxX family protein [Bauldia sp.]MCW5717820.1 DoxX family protein [Bauldia sp.]
MKAFQPISKLATQMGWPGEMPALTRFIAWAEIVGAVGMILPIALNILPWLTPLAAIGFVIIQVLAIALHLRRGERSVLPFNLVLLALSLFVAIGRFELF